MSENTEFHADCAADGRVNRDAKSRKSAIVTGGGTAGHIHPALSIARALEAEGYEILYIGSGAEDCLDRELVGKTHFAFVGLDLVTPLLKPCMQTVKSVFSILRAVFQCRKRIKKMNPDIVIGTGGFVSLPVLIAAILSGKKTAVHEQNVYPGFTNRHLARFVNAVFLTFPGSRKYFSRSADQKMIVSGIPLVNRPTPCTQEEYEARIQKEIRILVTGGSLGSQFFNDTVIAMYREGFLPDCREIRTRLSCGRMYHSSLSERYGDVSSHKNLEITPFISDMSAALREADILISRAGSSSVFEGIVASVPAIVIPSPNVTGDHQTPNARYWESLGAAVFLEEKNLTAERLSAELLDLIRDKKKLASMKQCASNAETPKAEEVIVECIRRMR